MKKQVKKLKLAKETVVYLETGNLLEIKGGLMMSYEFWCNVTEQVACG
jgi:hypothetical protein